MAMFDDDFEELGGTTKEDDRNPDEANAAKAQKLAMSAASEIEDMRQTARGRIEGHLRQAERFRVLSEAHSHVASLWREIADSGMQPVAVPQKRDPRMD